MDRRRLGKTDMVASVLGFGGAEIGYQGVSGRTVVRLLGGALDAGLNVIDTAECYENSEALIGRAIGGGGRGGDPLPQSGRGPRLARDGGARAPAPARRHRNPRPRA